MPARRLIPFVLALQGLCAQASPPELEMVSVAELASPLAVELLNPPAELGGVDGFTRLWRDPRFPSVLMRRHGATYAAFRRNGPVSNGRTRSTVPSDIVYFVGRPTEADIAGVWPDAVRSSRPERRASAPGVVRTVLPTVEPAETSATPRMAHMPTRVRRLRALAEKYAPAG